MKKQLAVTIEVEIPDELDHADFDPMEVACVHVIPEELLIDAEWKA